MMKYGGKKQNKMEYFYQKGDTMRVQECMQVTLQSRFKIVDGNFIGVLKAVVNVESITNEISHCRLIF